VNLSVRPGVNLLRRQIAASTAALITIIALAIDPFTQQIIDYYSQPLAVTGRQAGIPRTNNFTQFSRDYQLISHSTVAFSVLASLAIRIRRSIVLQVIVPSSLITLSEYAATATTLPRKSWSQKTAMSAGFPTLDIRETAVLRPCPTST